MAANWLLFPLGCCIKPRRRNPGMQFLGVDGAGGFCSRLRDLHEPGLEGFQERSPFRVGFPHAVRLRLFSSWRPVYEVYRSQV